MMSQDFVPIQDIIEQWGFSGFDDPNGPTSAVMTYLRKIKAPALRGHPSKRGVFGLTVKQFEKANALRDAFNKTEAAKPAKPAPRRAVTVAEFADIKADAVANGFMDMKVIGKAWGMKWSKVLEHIHYLDKTVKDCARLIPSGIESQLIPQSERCGLYTGEFDRLTAIRNQRQADQEADQQASNDQADAEADRLRAENERYKQAKLDAFKAWDDKVKAAKALIDEKWTEYYSKVKASRADRNAKIQEAEAACNEVVAPLALKLRSDVEDLGEEPLSGPRVSKESELWWTYQHARNALSLTFGNEVGVHEDAKREAVEDARDFHRQSVWKWRKELYAAIKPLKKDAYKIFRSDPEKVDKSQFDLKSRV